MNIRSLSRFLGLSFLTTAMLASAQQPGQWNVNASGTWFNGSNWLTTSAPNGAGTSAFLNQDISGAARHAADFVSSFTATTVGTAQLFTLPQVPVNGTIAVTDSTGGLHWSQGRGSNSTLWTVSYNSGSNQISVTYNPALTSNRTLTVAFASAAAATFVETIGITERVATTTNTTTYKKVLNVVPSLSALAVTDGIFFWKQGVGSSNATFFNVSFDSATRTLTVTYTPASAGGTGRNIMAAYCPAGMSGNYGVTVNTNASGTPISFSRTVATVPVQDSNFKVTDTSFNWSSTAGSSSGNFGVTFNSGANTFTVNYLTAAITTLGTGKTLTTTYTAASAAAKNVTLGNLFLGDISASDRMDVRLNSLTFNNNGKTSQLNNIVGNANEIASNISLSNNLAVAVRTGGDSIGTNSSSFLISGNISGTGSLTKLDSGNWTLSGNNTYVGDTFIRSNGGTTFLKNTSGAGGAGVNSTLTSPNIILGNTNRDGNSSVVVQLGASNQIADTSKLIFDAASGRNSYLRMLGFSETVGGILDTTGQGVIENTESETGVTASSVLTVNNAASDVSAFNGFFRNKSSNASSGKIGLTKSGAGELTLANNNILYSGPTVVDGGVLRLLNITGAGNLPFNPMSITASSTGGAHSSATAPRFQSAITNTAAVDLSATTDWTFGSVISGTGVVSKSGKNAVVVTNNNNYTGPTTIKDGTLTLATGLTGFLTNGFSDFTQVLDDNPGMSNAFRNFGIYGDGKLSATSAINLESGTLRILNAQTRAFHAGTTPVTLNYNNGDRINNAAPINASSGTLNFTNTSLDTLAATNYAETVGLIKLTGGVDAASVSRPLNTGVLHITTTQALVNSTSTLTLSGLSREKGGMLEFSGTDLGSNARNKINFATGTAPIINATNPIIGGYATILTTVVNPDSTTTTLYDFATYDPTLGVRAFQGYVQPTAAGGSTSWTVDMRTAASKAAVAKLNIVIRDNNADIKVQTIPSDPNPQVVINSLKMDTKNTFDNTNSSRTLNLFNGSQRHLVIGTGGILSRGATNTITLGDITAGDVGGNNYDLNVWVGESKSGALTISSPIIDNGVNPVTVVKGGPGRLRLNSSNSVTNWSGGTHINDGDVQIASIDELGQKPIPGSGYRPGYLVLNGGALWSLQQGTGNTSITFENEMGVYLGSGGGTFSMPKTIDPDTLAVTQTTVFVKSSIRGPGSLVAESANGANTGGTLRLSGDNQFLGNVTATTGATLIFDGGSNKFKGVSVEGGTVLVNDANAFSDASHNLLRPAVNIAAGQFTLGVPNLEIGSLTGAGEVNTTGSAVPGSLRIFQDGNSTFSGGFSDDAAPALSFEKAGKGTLNLTGGASDFRGKVTVAEGVLAVASLSNRNSASSIGNGSWDQSVAGGLTTLTSDKRTASNLLIADGAALSYTGEVPGYTNRGFTIGSGQAGASILANSTFSGSSLSWVQFPLRDAQTDDVLVGQYDGIAFETPNASTTLNLGGRNPSGNRFGMDLHDNGFAPLNLTKTGDGQWVLGEIDILTNKAVTSTPSRNDFTGRTTIYQGTVGVTQDGVFGAAGGDSVNLIGGNLDLNNVNYAVNESLSMAGGRLRALVGANNAWAGGVSLDVGSTVEIGTGAKLALNGVVSGKGGLTKVGFGTLTLSNSNTFTGGMNVSEGTMRLDYSTNLGSKLADGATLNLGGGRSGGTLQIYGGNSNVVEIISGLTLGLGQSRITRSDIDGTGVPSNTTVLLNALDNRFVQPGAALDVAANGLVKTDRLNDAGGLLGNWFTVNKSNWATNSTNAGDGPVTGYSAYSTDAWAGAGSNTDITTSTPLNTPFTNAMTNTLRFASPSSVVVELSGTNFIKDDGILVAPSAGTASSFITGGTIVPTDNGFGGNLVVHQNGATSALTIGSTITNAVGAVAVTGQAYYNGLANRLLLTPAMVRGISIGTSLVGQDLEPGTSITDINFVTGEVTLSKGALSAIDVPLTINGSATYTGDLSAQGASNIVRVKTGNPSALPSSGTISGGAIPGGVNYSGKVTDPLNSNWAIVTLSQNIPAPASYTTSAIAGAVIGQMYFNGQTNRLRLPLPGMAVNLYVGMPITGDPFFEPGTFVSSIDFVNGDVFFNQGRTAQMGIAISVTGQGSFTGDTMVAGTQNRVRVFGTATALKGLVNAAGSAISGGTIPGGTVISAIALDDPDNPTFANLTINQNIPVPAVLNLYPVSLISRNGIAKIGDGVLLLTGNNTFSGPVIVSGGKVVTSILGNVGDSSPLGTGSLGLAPPVGQPKAVLGAGGIVVSGGTMSYNGESVRTDRGFTINEVGAIEVAKSGVVADFAGNLSGGVGGASGVLQKTGDGILKLTRSGGSVASTLSPATVGIGGATNIGGFEVRNGTLQLAYENANSNENSNRFAAQSASATLSGGKLELVGLADVKLDDYVAANGDKSPNENRTQQLFGQFSIGMGASQVWVTGAAGSTTTLALQDPNNPVSIARSSGATVTFVENPLDGVAAINLALPVLEEGRVLPYATFRDTSKLTRPGINDFAAIEPFDNGIVSADSKGLYKIASDIGGWTGSGYTNVLISEGGGSPYSGSTPSPLTIETGIRFFEPQTGVVTISDRLDLKGGAILVGTFVGNNAKSITGGTLTSRYTSGNISRTLTATTSFPVNEEAQLRQYDLMVHNYNPAGSFEISSNIVDNVNRGVKDTMGTVTTVDDVKISEPVNLIHTGTGTTLISGANTYSGNTFLTGGVLLAPASSPTAIPGGLGATGGQSNIQFNGGVLGLTGSFSRPVGKGATDVQFLGSGGFAAYAASVDVNFGGALDPISWRTGGDTPFATTLILGSNDAVGNVRVLNPFDLGGNVRQVLVNDGKGAVDGELAGNLSGAGGSIAKVGYGTLRMSGIGSQTGGTLLSQGTLAAFGDALGSGPLDIGTSDSSIISDRVTMRLEGGTVQGSTSIGNKNSTGITELGASSNATLAKGLAVNRDAFIGSTSGHSLTVNGAVTGSGRITVTDGGSLVLNGAGSFAGMVVRDGAVVVGNSAALGSTTLTLGDTVGTLMATIYDGSGPSPVTAAVKVDRSTAGRTLLLNGAIFDPTGNGIPGSSSGRGAFSFTQTEILYDKTASATDRTLWVPISKTLVIDGRTYTKDDAHQLPTYKSDGSPLTYEKSGKFILVDGESDHPERNGIYELYYEFQGSGSSDLPFDDADDDIVILRRIPELDDLTELSYGNRVTVTNGSAAGKTYFFATDKPATPPPADEIGRVIISAPVYMKEESSLSPNVSLLASAAGLNVPNNVAIGTGLNSVTLGGASGLTSGSSTFSGNIAGTAPVRLQSETSFGQGVSFTGVLSGGMALTKVGTGTATLAGANTFTGGVQVVSGSLLVSNGAGSGTGTGLVTVTNFGSSLGGIGVVGGATTLLNGGSLTPGDPAINSGIGPLAFASSLIFGKDSSAVFEIGSDISFDHISIADVLSVDPSAVLKVLLNYDPSSSFTPGIDSITYDLIDWAKTPLVAGSLANHLVLPTLSGLFAWDTSTFGTTGQVTIEKINLNSAPKASFGVKEVAVREGQAGDGVDTLIKVAVQLDRPTASGLDVAITAAGNARIGLDYNLVSPVVAPGGPISVHFDAGETSKDMIIAIVDDPISDPGETAIFNITSTASVKAGIPGSLLVTIQDNDGGQTAGDSWKVRNALPTNETLRGIAAVGSQAVAVGDVGTILSTADGITWTPQFLAAAPRLTAIAANSTTYAVVSGDGTVVTSTDGINWTLRNGGGVAMNDIVWTGAKFIAGGSGGAIRTSTDANVWESKSTTGSSTDVNGLAVGPGGTLLVAVGNSGSVLTFDDSVLNVTPRTSNTSAHLRSVAFNGSDAYVAVGDNGTIISTSDIAQAWTVRSTGVFANLAKVTWDGTRFLAAGDNGTLLTSTDGVAWTAQSSGITKNLESVGKFGGQLIAVGVGGSILTSSNATAWTSRSSGPTASFNAVASTALLPSGQVFIGVGNGGTVATSADGAAWTVRTSGVSQALNGIVSNSSQSIAVGAAGAAIRSTVADGSAWTSIPTGSAQNLRDITQRSTLYVAVGDAGTIYSFDNTTWTNRSPSISENLRGVATSSTLFVAVGDSGRILTSSDGVSWATQPSPTTATLNDIIFLNGTGFIAVGSGGVVLTSTTGFTWKQEVTPSGADLRSIAANTLSGGSFQLIATGAGGAAFYASNSVSAWVLRPARTAADLLGVAVLPFSVHQSNGTLTGRFVAVGTDGAILSTDNVTPDRPVLAFTSVSENVTEGTSINLTVSINPAPSAAVTVPFTLGGTSTKTTDYSVTPATLKLTFGVNQASQVITLSTVGDKINETGSPETVILTLGTPTSTQAIDVAANYKICTVSVINDFRAADVVANPSPLIVNTGANFQLVAGGSGSFALTEQWLKGTAAVVDSAIISGSKTDILKFTGVTLANAGKYSLKVTNPIGTKTSSGAELVVVEKLADASSPLLKLAKDNLTTTLTANAMGTATAFSYKWYVHRDSDGVGVFNTVTDGGDYLGSATKTLTIKTLSAAANEEGIYYCKVSLLVGSVAVDSKDSTYFDTRVAKLPDIVPTPTTTGIMASGRVGTPFYFKIPRSLVTGTDVHYAATSYTAAPLPAGLKLNVATGEITGTPTAAGDFKTIKITATNPQGVTPAVTSWIHIDPVPSGALGTFVALAQRSGTPTAVTPFLPTNGTFGLGARVDLTTTAAGAFSGKLTIGLVAYPFTGTLNTSTANPTGTATIIRAKNTTLTFAFTLGVTSNTDLLTGTLADNLTTSVAGWRATTAPVNGRLGLHNFAATIDAALEGSTSHPLVPQGDTYASANVAATGAVVVAGKAADGTAIATTAPISPSGQFLVYQGMYAVTNPGSIIGTPKITVLLDTNNLPNEVHPVSGNLTWSRSAQKAGSTKVYQGGFATPLLLTVDGGFYKAPSGLGIALDAQPRAASSNYADTVNATVTFFDSTGIPTSATSTPANLDDSNAFNSVYANLFRGFYIKAPATVVAPPVDSYFVADTDRANPASVKMTVTAATGLITGTFNLVDTVGTATVKRTVTYYAMVIPDTSTPSLTDGVGMGSYLLTGQTTANPTLSGRVTVRPVSATALPSPWFAATLGTVTGTTASFSSPTYTIQGAGTIAGTSDTAAFVNRPMTDDGSIIAHLSVSGITTDAARVGVMLRETTGKDAKMVMLAVDGTGHLKLESRDFTSNAIVSTNVGTVTQPPVAWLKLERVIDTFTAYTSTDGTTWTQVGSPINISMTSTIYGGMAVSSGTNTATTTEQFDGVVFTP